MSLRDFALAAEIIQAHPARVKMSGPVLPTTIAQAEQLLGVTFPTSYRRFLALFGYLRFVGAFEISGLFEGQLDAAGHLNVVWLTRYEREIITMPQQFLHINELGDGTGFYLDTARMDATGECPVVAMHGGVPFQREEEYNFASDFGRFLLDLVQEALESEQDT